MPRDDTRGSLETVKAKNFSVIPLHRTIGGRWTGASLAYMAKMAGILRLRLQSRRNCFMEVVVMASIGIISEGYPATLLKVDENVVIRNALLDCKASFSCCLCRRINFGVAEDYSTSNFSMRKI